MGDIENTSPSPASMEVDEKPQTGGEVSDFWEDRVFLVIGKLHGSGVLVEKKQLITAAHLGFKLDDHYTVKGTHGREFRAKCCFIDKLTDFAILTCDEFKEHAVVPRVWFNKGWSYFYLGYPNHAVKTEPSIAKSRCEGRTENSKFHYDLSPGALAGYSGGPVVTKNKKFCGIVIGPIKPITEQTPVAETRLAMRERSVVRILPSIEIEQVYERFRLGKLNSDDDSLTMPM